ncbi:uncharacterized protein LOC112572023 [Pomacea canaliculata]|uniref:uncharacterized protein LOC112572023 n=1 Tax=Pomacea canaliculata TaxID=400727 RepID=UPI000D731B7C|nr:uncharacterized protein LOC112572023 [Pomacea canaliculata]
MPDMAQARHQRTVLLALDGGHASDFAFQTYMTTIRRDGDQAVLFTCKQLGNILQSFWKTAVLTYDKEALAGRLHKDEGRDQGASEALRRQAGQRWGPLQTLDRHV